MKKLLLTLAIAFLLVSCKDGGMETISPLIGTWEGETEDVGSKFTFEKNTFIREDKRKFPGGLPGYSGITLSTGTYTDHGTAFTLYGEMYPEEGAKIDYQITDNVLIISLPQSRDPVHHNKIN